MAEVNWDLAIKNLSQKEMNYRAVSKFPAVRRDLALLIDRSVSAEQVQRSVEAVLGDKLVDFTVFDLFMGKGIENLLAWWITGMVGIFLFYKLHQGFKIGLVKFFL